MKTLTVDLGDRSYSIHIGADLLGQGDLLQPLVQGRQIMIVSNETVAPLYLHTLQSSLHDCRNESVILTDDEQFKHHQVLNTIFVAQQ